jgi:hypothetical protein
MDLAVRKCFHHPQREAAARCPGCGRFFCRECITEHQGRVLCAACLAELQVREQRRGRRFPALISLLQGLAGLWLAWLFFDLLARMLLRIPADFHENAVFKWWGP